MHFIFGTRGIYHNVAVWKTLMQSHFFPWERFNLNVCECGRKKEEHVPACDCKEFKPRREVTSVQGALRPIQLWEFVFPEENLNEVLGNMALSGELIEAGHLGTAGSKYGWLIRKALKLDPLPVVDLKNFKKTRMMQVEGVATFPIGLKKDFKREHNFGELGSWLQEGL